MTSAAKAGTHVARSKRKGADMRISYALAWVAACAALAEPCLAAGTAGDPATLRGPAGAFAGVRIAMPFGGARRAAPVARLQVAPSFAAVDARSGVLVGTRTGAGVELGLGRNGAPAFEVAGRSAPELKRQLGFKGSTPYVVIGGVVLLVVLLAAVASAQPKPGPRPGDFGP
jgi:hypothetical protein